MFDKVMAFMRAAGSALSEKTAVPLLNLVGYGPDDDEDDEEAEVAAAQEMFQSLGVVSRPLPPEGDLFMEALAARTSDGAVAFACRDQRIHKALNPGGGSTVPKPGQSMLAGYRGAFVGFQDTDANSGSAKANIATMYVPYQFDGSGTATKAHVITLDPTSGNESVSVVHAAGMAITMKGTELTLKSASGVNSIVIDNSGIRIYGNVQVMGRMAVGVPTVGTAVALPVLTGSPGTPVPSIDLIVATPPP